MYNIGISNSVNDEGETVDYSAVILSDEKNETEIFVKHFNTSEEVEREAKSICDKLGLEVSGVERVTVSAEDFYPF